MFSENVASHLREAFGKLRFREKTLRASNLGLPLRKLWFSIKTPVTGARPAHETIMFLYGNILEELVLLLAKEAGHEVTEQQKQVRVDGVLGHKDARIDGVPVDVKSASKFSYNKFATGEFMLDDATVDPFGYKTQLGFYAKADEDDKAALLPISKESGELCVLLFDAYKDLPDVNHKIEQARIVLERDEPPVEKCYPEVPRGKSGNLTIHKLCTFCDHKHKCWEAANDGKGLISHTYADGKVYFTKIVRDPLKKKDYSDNPPDDDVLSTEELSSEPVQDCG